MEAAPQRTAPWSTMQAYIIAVCCLILGAAVGYLLRSSAAPAATSLATAARPEVPQAGQQPTPEQMKHMADKRLEPLLAKLRDHPNDSDLLAQVAKTYLYVRDFPDAAAYYERSVQIKPDPRVLTTLGGIYHIQGEEEKAIGAWEHALRLDPGYADALYNLGMVKWQTQHDEAAIQAWTTLLKANPGHPQRAQVEKLIARAREHLGRKPR